MASGAIYELAILLTLKDAASGGLGRLEDRLRGAGREGRATLKTFQDLRSGLDRNLSIAGVGLGGLMMLKKGVDAAGEYESALLDLRSAYQEAAVAGALSLQDQQKQLQGLGVLAVDLGNKLQGSTQDYAGILTALKQAGVDGDTVLKGAGRSAGYLANVTGALTRGMAREQAKELGQFGLMFKLKPEEFESSVNLFAALKDKFDIESGSLIESAKYFQATSNQLGITGSQGAADTVKFFALLKRQAGMEGSMAGTGARAFFMQLATEEKKLKELQKETGIELRPFDDKGTFRGYEAMFKEMEKFRGLNQQQSTKWLNKVFGERGQEVASAMVKVGVDGWRNITSEAGKAVPVNEKINQQMDLYQSKVEALQGSLTNLQATAFMPMLNTVKPLVDKSNEGVSALQEWTKANPGLAQTSGNLFAMGSITLTVVGGIGAMATAWRMWKVVSSIGVNQAGQLTFLKALRTETAATATTMQVAAGRAGLYGRTLGRIPSAVTTTIALVGVENAIANLYELIQAYKDLEDAKNKEKKAGQESMNTLNRLEQDYRGRGEQVPQQVYSERARDVIDSLNRNNELSASLEPGSHFFYSMYRWMTFQPTNPYIGGLGASFDPRQAQFAIKERAPELASPEVMAAFLKKLREFQLPADKQGQTQLAELQRKEIAAAVQKAFPESYQKAVSAMNLQSLAGLDTYYNSVTKSLIDLQQPVNALPDPLNKTSESATRAAASLDRFAGRLNNFQMPTPTVLPWGVTPGQTPTYNFGPAPNATPGITIPSRATGGIVQRGGFVEVHDREAIVPARVTDRWPEGLEPVRVTERWRDGTERVQLREDVARTILHERTMHERDMSTPAVNVTVTYSPRVEIAGNADAGAIKELLQTQSRNLVGQIEDALALKLERHKERA